MDECLSNTLSVEKSSPIASADIEGLERCSNYSFTISALSNAIPLESEPFSFETSYPPASSPENFSYEILDDDQLLQISFDPVACASSYILNMTKDNEEEEIVQEVQETKTTLNLPGPCVSFWLTVKSVVDSEESETGEVLENTIPPQTSGHTQPNLRLQNAFNSTAVILVEQPEINSNCEVEFYDVRYRNVGSREQRTETIYLNSTEEGKISLTNFPQPVDRGISIEARIKYKDFEVWTPFTSFSNEAKVAALTSSESYSVLVPIVIGILVGLVMIVIVICFLVKKQRTRAKYTTEKAANQEELAKLRNNISP